ncbi:MAG: saccharopine dehydrogenase family protein [Myxococcaceae bacterium]
MQQRAADVALYGATGFTGALVAEALGKAAPAGAKLVLAGRNRAKLETVRSRLSTGARFELMVADSEDRASLEKLAKTSRVVCSTVGPFARYGVPLVEACARSGAHYADITGEVQFIRASIDQFNDVAAKSGARIVHTCGFDSIPSDLGVLLLHEALKARGESGALREVTFVVEMLAGGLSGGTLSSMFNMAEESRKDPSLFKLMRDPYALSPDRAKEPSLGREGDLLGVSYDRKLHRWIGPFVMAAINTRVVRRSNALLGFAYGRQFRYREVLSTAPGLKGLMISMAVTATMGGFGLALSTPLTRRWLLKKLPQAGEGPSEERRQKGHFRIVLHGQSEQGTELQAIVGANGDPGYSETSKMLSQSALCLAFDHQALPARYGVLTPAVSMGRVLIERLRSVGMTFSVP